MLLTMEAPHYRLWRTSEQPAEPPVPQWMRNIWMQHGRPVPAGTSGYGVEAQALLWFVSQWYRSRSPYRFALPAELVDWLNATEIDLTEFIRSRPGIKGPVSSSEGKFVSRLLFYAADVHGRLADINSTDRYYELLEWYALELMGKWNLPGSLLPTTVINLLNTPVESEDVPITVGMWLYLKRLGLVDSTSDVSVPASLFAMSFKALDAFLVNGDPRLIPRVVSRFWSQRPFPNNILTAFEYVLARIGDRLDTSDSVDEVALRDWYHRNIVYPSKGFYELLSGVPALSPTKLDDVRWSVCEAAILNYRDHHTVAGLSNSGRRALDALMDSGIPTFDLHFQLGRSRLEEEVQHNRTIWVNARRRLHILNLNPEYVPDWYYCNLPRIGAQDYIIGQFFWELSTVSKMHEPGIELVDEIWTASEYLSDIYIAATGRPVVLMGHAIVPVDPLVPPNRNLYDIGRNTFVFLSNFDAGSIVERKNPLGVIKAFQAAFPRRTDDVTLVIKTRNLEHLQTARDRIHWELAAARVAIDSRIKVISDTLSAEEMAALYRMSDCFVSLHRSEGFGQGLAEAMAHGKPVIATNYSGVCDFCTAETAKLVGYDLIRVKPNEYPYLDADRVYYWADPDLKEAARHMEELVTDRAQAQQLGSLGKDLVMRKYSVAAVHSKYVNRLRELGFTSSHHAR